MRTVLFVLIIIFFPLATIAQSFSVDTFYLNKDWELTKKANAKYMRLSAIKDNKYNGEFKDVKIPNKTLIAKGSYKNGRLNGKYAEYYLTGAKLLEGEYLNGKQTGIWTYYYPEGSKQIVLQYLEKAIKVLEYYDKDNTKKISEGDGTLTLRFNIGETPIYLNASYKNGYKHGKWIFKDLRNNSPIITEKYRKNQFLTGINHQNRNRLAYPTIFLDNLFYSKRVMITDKYVIEDEILPNNYPQLTAFSIKITNNLYVLNNQTIPNFPSGSISEIEIGPDGTIWFYVQKKGLFSIENNELKQHIESSIIKYTKNNLHIDKDGVAWITAPNKWNNYNKAGLLRITDDSISFLNVENSGLTCNKIQSISSHNDSIIIGTCNCINIYDKKNKEWSYLFNPRIHKTKLDTSKILNSRLYDRYKNETISKNRKFRCFLYLDGKLWVGTLQGLECYERDKILLYNKNTNPAFKANHVSAIEPFKDGFMVFFDEDIKYGGITQFTNHKWKHLDKENSRFIINKTDNTANFEKNIIWAEGAKSNLIKLDDKNLFNYVPFETLFNFHVNDIAADNKGNLYLGTRESGIFIRTSKSK